RVAGIRPNWATRERYSTGLPGHQERPCYPLSPTGKRSMKDGKTSRQPATWQTQHQQLGFPPLDANGNPRYNDTTIIAKVAALPSLDAKDLRALWREYFGEEAPRKKRDYLIPRLAWRIQELAYGGLSDP